MDAKVKSVLHPGEEIAVSRKTLRLHCLQHAEFEGPAAIAEWARRRGHALSTTHLYRNEVSPAPDSFDWLIVMGGPMSVNDESAHPWLRAEKVMIEQSMAASRFVLGVCLGSQLIADCLGSRVVRNRYREIGWFPVEFYPEPGSLFEGFPSQETVCHWHGETYEVPRGATLRATSDGCAVQAFETANAIGLQFHLEFGEADIVRMVSHCASEIGSGPYEQSSDSLLQGERQHGKSARRLLSRILHSVESRLS